MVQVRADGPASPVETTSAVDQAAERPLGKHEELGTRCSCGPDHLRLRSDQGELVRPRGGCVNKCDYCAQLAAVENCEMLVNDALEGDAPQIIAILTTRTATLDMSAFKRGRQEVTRAVRKRWPQAEYAYEVEFTTGYGPRSGGLRRPHWNWFWKGIPRHEWWIASWVIVTTWCRYVDADPAAQYVDVIRNEVGLTKYVTEHFMKASQRPPEGFAGQRFCCSDGYFGSISVSTVRARARESLLSKRERWKAIRAGHDAHDVELVVHQAVQLAHRTVWVLTNERGARLGAVGHDRRRMVLDADVRPGSNELIAARWNVQARQAVEAWREYVDEAANLSGDARTVELVNSPQAAAPPGGWHDVGTAAQPSGCRAVKAPETRL